MKGLNGIAYSLFTGILIILFVCHGHSQNKAPNPSFEEYEYCPVGYGAVGMLPCRPWRSLNNAAPDYFHACAVFVDVKVPDNGFGFQEAHTGVAYTGGYTHGYRSDSSSLREFILAPMQGAPMVKGNTYQVRFYTSLANDYCGVDKIGAYFSAARPSTSTNRPPNVKPQIEADLGIITDTVDWVLIEGCFIAQGGEQWVSIGNFYLNENTAIDTSCGHAVSYYFYDDISIIDNGPAGVLSVELGEPVMSCQPYTITPGWSGADYLWEDGSTDSTLTVISSGTYSVTITNECNQGVDSLEVVILEENILDIGPPTISICAGEVITISLDSTIGLYTWQDGSHLFEYIINTPGLYQVTIDGPCGMYNDEILVNYINPIDPPSLADSMALCGGDNIIIDPGVTEGNILWHDGSTDATLGISAPGIVSFTVSNICGAVSDSIWIYEVLSPTAIDLGRDTTICKGDSYLLSIQDSGNSIIWQDGSHHPEMLIDEAQVYWVELKNECGITRDSIKVRIDSLIPTLSWNEMISWCPGDIIHLSAIQPFDADYIWSDGSTSTETDIAVPGIYSVDISTLCNDLHQAIEIIGDPSCFAKGNIYIPNVFSPNKDQVNDFFSIFLSDEIELIQFHAFIYDRWGNQVFSSDSYPFLWDGTFQQQNVQNGVFAYLIQMEYSILGETYEKLFRGNITLIR
ncbi:MAG TPA: gliding motility-associated C-terminal domain-containing protein [Saprospiraceae bacterium]|nr:gliding motility-associated C-terminal domain-containing protein [Saprospiraceae bacterium]